MLEPYYDQTWSYFHSHRHQFDHVSLSDLANQLVFINDSYLGLTRGFDQAADIIRRARRDTGRLPVLCLDSNPCDSSHIIQELNQRMDVREYFVLDPDIRPDRCPQPNQAPWPSWLILQQISHQGLAPPPRESRISMLSGSMRYHRLQLFRAVKPHVRPQDVVVINRMGNFGLSVPPGALTADEINQWEQELPWANDVTHIDHPEWGPRASWQLPPDQGGNSHAAFRACVNITNETGAPPTLPQDQCLLSEKTWKAYRSGCLVIHYGAAGAAEFLASTGVEIWQPWDHQHLDQHKIPLIRDLFDRDDIWHQYQQHQDLVLHNLDLTMSPAYARSLANMMLEKITDYL
jgi:hypothetical protein